MSVDPLGCSSEFDRCEGGTLLILLHQRIALQPNEPSAQSHRDRKLDIDTSRQYGFQLISAEDWISVVGYMVMGAGLVLYNNVLDVWCYHRV